MTNLLFSLCVFLSMANLSPEPSKQLKKALDRDNPKLLAQYLEEGHSIDDCYTIKDADYNVLTLSIKYNRFTIFAYCLEHEADLNQICEDKTPLMYAIKYDRIGMFKALLVAGADKDKSSKNGKSIQAYAKKYKRMHYLELLE